MRLLRARAHCGWLQRTAAIWVGVVLLSLGWAVSAGAGEPATSSTDVQVLDLALVDETGLARNFRSEVIGDRIAVLNFVYTTCKTACPMASAMFGQVQEQLGPRLGEEVVLVSLSIDPVTDRPARLLAAARQFHSKAGWTWLTGDKATMDRVLHGLGAVVSNAADHPTMVMIGDGISGQWVRVLGFPSPDDIMTHVERLRDARRHAAGKMAVSAVGPGAAMRREAGVE